MTLTITPDPEVIDADKVWMAWQALGDVAALAHRIGPDVIAEATVASAEVRMVLDDEADVWEIGPHLGVEGRALWIEPGTGDVYRVAFGTYTFAGFRLELRSLADPDTDWDALSPDAVPGVLDIL